MITPVLANAKAPYSPAIKVGDLVYVSGQTPALEDGTQLKGTVEEKTVQIFKNLDKVLKAGGTSLDRVVKVNIFLTSMDDFSRVNKVYATYFPKVKPARSCVAVKELPFKASIEIELVALSGPKL